MTSPALRWVCWPLPDRQCLEGNCINCCPRPPEGTEDGLPRRLVTRAWIATYAITNGLVLEDYWLDNGMFVNSSGVNA